METSVLVQRRSRYLIALYAVAAIWGVRAGLLPRARQNSDLVLGAAVGVLSVLLISTDAQLRGKPFPSTARWLLVAVWPAALAVYAVATRRLRGLWIVTKHVALAYAVFVASGFVARAVASALAPGMPLPP